MVVVVVVMIIVRAMMVMMIPPIVVMMVMVVIISMVMMVLVVNELHVRITARPVASRGGSGRVCDPQKRGGVWNGIKQFAK